MSNKFEHLSKIAQDEFGVTIKSKPSTGETFNSLYGETKDCKKREKQIEEIAKVIARRSKAFRNPYIAFMTTARKTADSLYNAGYRKQSEVAREIFEEIEYALLNNHCSDEWSDYPTPHYYEDLKGDIAELKKKYTEVKEK